MIAEVGSEDPQEKLPALIGEWTIKIANQREEAISAFDCLIQELSWHVGCLNDLEVGTTQSSRERRLPPPRLEHVR
jgi:hypothetical protein